MINYKGIPFYSLHDYSPNEVTVGAVCSEGGTLVCTVAEGYEVGALL